MNEFEVNDDEVEVEIIDPNQKRPKTAVVKHPGRLSRVPAITELPVWEDGHTRERSH